MIPVIRHTYKDWHWWIDALFLVTLVPSIVLLIGCIYPLLWILDTWDRKTTGRSLIVPIRNYLTIDQWL